MHNHQQNHWNDIIFYWYTNPAIDINGLSELRNRIYLCILDMCGLLNCIFFLSMFFFNC